MAEKEDVEKYLSLEDETSKPKVSKSKLKIPKLVKKRQVTNAELLLEGIIAKDPDHLSAYDNLIRIYKYLNRIEKKSNLN